MNDLVGNLKIGRVYDPTGPDAGARVLVDRLWPRGLSREAAALDGWCGEIAPSDELRRWYRGVQQKAARDALTATREPHPPTPR